jgi:alpha-galactosidase
MRAMLIIIIIISSIGILQAQTIYLDELNLTAMECGWGTPEAKKSVEGNPLKVGGQIFERGVGTERETIHRVCWIR